MSGASGPFHRCAGHPTGGGCVAQGQLQQIKSGNSKFSEAKAAMALGAQLATKKHIHYSEDAFEV
jgi:hypothetical protein